MLQLFLERLALLELLLELRRGVLKLVVELALYALEPFRLANVARDLCRADHTTGVVDDRRDTERHLDGGAIFSKANRLVVIDAIAAPQPADDLRLFMVKLRRDERE